MKKNSSNSMPNDYQMSDELKNLVLSYMEACNDDDYGKADNIIHLIKKYHKNESLD